MLARKTVLGAAVVLVVGLLLVGQSLSQPGQPRQREGARGAPGERPEGRQFDLERMRQVMEQRMREQLGATDQEWKVLGVRVMKVSELSRQLSGFGRGGMFFGGPRGPRGDQPDRRQGAPDRELSAVEKAQEQLRTTLENTDAKPEDIKKELTALRAAKEKTKQELILAQQELRKIVTVRQEALLVLMGMFD